MNILFAASECAPFAKTGGLGDVILALPKALNLLGSTVSVILPKYGDIPTKYKEQMSFIDDFIVPVGSREQYAGLFKLEYDGITFYFIDNEYYFKRHGSYGYFDDGERFAYFSRAVLEALPYLEEKPDVIHAHDWQTGPISVLLKAHYGNHPLYKDIKTVFTIHNLRYQGVFPKTVLWDLLDLSERYFHMGGLEYYGNVNYLKAGLAYSDVLTTVSPTYAEEIQMPYYGEHLDGFLREKNDELKGIVNGIDTDIYDPITDAALFQTYTDYEGKQKNKLLLQEALGLAVNVETPLITMVTRLVEQKGMDLILRVIHEIMALNVQCVILGTGETPYEDAFKDLASKYSGHFSFHPYFDEVLAHRIYAAGDLFLMPSQFEPCGIGQLLALRYGTLPVVRETGGLKDTVTPYNEFTGEGNGFSFTHYNAHDMLYTVERAINLYRFHPAKWRSLVTRAMAIDNSWIHSAKEYQKIYDSLRPVVMV